MRVLWYFLVTHTSGKVHCFEIFQKTLYHKPLKDYSWFVSLNCFFALKLACVCFRLLMFCFVRTCVASEQGHKDPMNPNAQTQEKIFGDEELTGLIDPIFGVDDANNDGFIDYPEFVHAQQKAATKPSP